MLRAQRAVPRVPPRVLALASRAMATRGFTRWAFDHYLEVAPPSFVTPRAGTAPSRCAAALAA